MPHARLHIVFPVLLVLAAGLLADPGTASRADEIEWKTGPDFRKQLEATIGLQWSDNPLRPALANLSRAQGVAIFLDRRVDPDQKVDFSVQNRRLKAALEQLAAQLDLGVGYVGDVVYIGPQPLTAKLATLAAVKNQQARGMPSRVSRRLMRLRPWSWPELSEPRALAVDLTTSAGLQIVDAEQIPHDLWPAVDLPGLSFADRLTLVLAGFDATFDLDPETSTVLLSPIPERVVLQQDYRAPGNTTNWEAELGKRYPRAKITQQERRIIVEGSWEDHQEIARLIRGEQVTRTVPVESGGQKVYELNIQDQPVGPLATALAKRLNLKIEFDPRISQDALGQRVSLSVKNASRDELLQAMLAPAGLAFRIEGDTLRVSPGAAPQP